MPDLSYNTLSLMGFRPKRIFPDLIPLVADDYIIARDFFISSMQALLGDICAYYQFGNISVPGISDLDILIICENADWKRVRLCAESVIARNGLLSYLFVHPPLVVGRTSVKPLKALHTLENLHFLSGRKDLSSNLKHESAIDGSSVVLARHALWNSFIRKHAAVLLHNRDVRLRNALLLYNNLLATAKHGNHLLRSPLVIPERLTLFRRNLLSSSCRQWEEMTLNALSELSVCLQSIDCNLDLQYEKILSNNASVENKMWYFMKPNILFVDNMQENESLSFPSWLKTLLRGVRIIEMPRYVMHLMPPLCQDLHLKVGGGPKTTVSQSGMQQKAEDLVLYRRMVVRFMMDAQRFNDRAYVSSLVLPFGASLDRLSVKQELLHMSRRMALALII